MCAIDNSMRVWGGAAVLLFSTTSSDLKQVISIEQLQIVLVQYIHIYFCLVAYVQIKPWFKN